MGSTLWDTTWREVAIAHLNPKLQVTNQWNGWQVEVIGHAN